MTLLPLRRTACWGFLRSKNPTASAGCEPANLGTKGQPTTSRPPKPLESLTVSLKTSKFANVQICQNVRIARSLLRSELGGVVSCQNSIMAKLKVGVWQPANYLLVAVHWHHYLWWSVELERILQLLQTLVMTVLLLRLCTVGCDPMHFDRWMLEGNWEFVRSRIWLEWNSQWQ
jgi:hypothetical protein